MNKSINDIPAEVKNSFEKALACRDAGDSDTACILLSTLISKYPNWAPPYSIKAGILFDHRRFQEAEECFRQAVMLNPKSEIASLGLFHSLWEQSKRDDALSEMKRFEVNGGMSQDYIEIIREIQSKISL